MSLNRQQRRAILRTHLSLADQWLRSDGYFLPTILAHTADGKAVPIVADGGVGSDEDKARFHDFARLCLIAHDAIGYSTVCEAWAAWFDPRHDTLVRPAQSDRRIEVVAASIITHDRADLAQAEILRHPDGSYKGLGKVETHPRFGGSMANLLPPLDMPPPTPEEKAALQDMLRQYYQPIPVGGTA